MKKDAPPTLNFLTKKAPYKGLGADSEEKHEPESDIDTAAADSLKVLDPKRPIREADIAEHEEHVRFVPEAEVESIHSISLSTRATSVEGTSTPIAFAALSSLLKNLEIGALLVFFALGFW